MTNPAGTPAAALRAATTRLREAQEAVRKAARKLAEGEPPATDDHNPPTGQVSSMDTGR